MRIGKESSTDLATRFQIISGIAEGVSFGHSNMPSRRPFHGYLLPCNVLLDSARNPGEFTTVPKIINIGISDVLEKSAKAVTQGVSGPIGYSAPECVSYGLPSKESDVYTFGMIALEIITGMDFSQEGQSVDGKSSLRFKVSNNHYH